MSTISSLVQPQVQKNLSAQAQSKWDDQEIKRLLELHHKFGNKWAHIAHLLISRKEGDVKNRFYSYIRQASRKIKTNDLAVEEYSLQKLQNLKYITQYIFESIELDEEEMKLQDIKKRIKNSVIKKIIKKFNISLSLARTFLVRLDSFIAALESNEKEAISIKQQNNSNLPIESSQDNLPSKLEEDKIGKESPEPKSPIAGNVTLPPILPYLIPATRSEVIIRNQPAKVIPQIFYSNMVNIQLGNIICACPYVTGPFFGITSYREQQH